MPALLAICLGAADGRRLRTEPFTVELAGSAIGARGYITLTTACMTAFGADVREEGNARWVIAPTGYRAADYLIEPDASAATYLWGAEVLTHGKIDLGVAATEFSQPDARSYDMIAAFPHMPPKSMAARCRTPFRRSPCSLPTTKRPCASPASRTCASRNATASARLSLGLNNIRAGLAREEGDDLIVTGDPALAGQTVSALIDTFADHRIAMSFALAGLKTSGIAIENPSCVAKTYPNYWDALARWA